MCQHNKQFDAWWNEQVKNGDGGWTSLERLAAKDAWKAATKLLEEKFTSTNTASFQLPLSVESCIKHVLAVWKDDYMSTEARCAIEETHDFIERQLQALL